MKITLRFVIVVSSIIGFSCQHHNEKSFSMNYVAKPISELKQQVIEYGDSCAYEDLKIQLLDFVYGSEDLLSYAMIMANKYDYTQAYFDVFDCLTIPFLSDISHIDPKTAQIAVEYLLVAAEKGHVQASDIVVSCSITPNCSNPVAQICKIYQ